MAATKSVPLSQSLNIWMVESFFSGSHKEWNLSYQKYTQHQITIFSLPGRHWKFRMQASAYDLAQQLNARSDKPDYIIVSDMVNLAELKGYLKPALQCIPTGLYMHENQITYPWSPDDPDTHYRQDRTYGLINIKSYLAADEVYFNSLYHLESFQNEGKNFLAAFPDGALLRAFLQQTPKASVLPIGLDLPAFRQKSSRDHQIPTILWNHRWEYDKDPESFFRWLKVLKEDGYDFRLIICGSKQKKYPPIFKEARQIFKQEIMHWGFADSKKDYHQLLKASDITLVSSRQDFFGISVVEAIAAGAAPILPYRLAYPAHLPVEYHKDFYYKNEAEALQLLKSFVKHPPSLPADIDHHIRQYDWSKMRYLYDATFAEAAKKKV